MRAPLIGFFNSALIANGIAMLALPAIWYGLIPGVAETGPFNPHFIRDIGGAYLVAGGSLMWFWFDRRARPAAIAGAAFLTLHAFVHFWDAASGRETLRQLLIDLPTVVLPGLVVFKIARPGTIFRKEIDHVEMADAAASRRLRAGL